MFFIKKQFPIFLILLCNMFIYYIFKEVSDRYYAVCSLSSEALFKLEFVFFPIISVLLSIIYIVLNKKFSPYKLALGSYGFLFLISFFIFFIILPAHGEVKFCIGMDSPLKEIITHWQSSFLILLSSLWTPLSLMLFYGYINEKFSLEDATKLYPFLGIFAIILSQLFIGRIFPLGQKMMTQHLIYGAGFCSLILIVINWICFQFLEHTSPSPLRKDSFSKVFLLVICALGFLNVSIEFSKFLSLIFSKSALNAQESLNSQYLLKTSNFSFFKFLAIFIAITTLLFLRMYIKEHLTKGWKHFFYGIALISTLTSTALILFSFSDMLFNKSVLSEYSSSFHKRIVHIGSNYQLFINIISYPTFICLFQIILTKLNCKQRFITQVVITLLLHKIGYFLSLLFKYTAYSIENMTITFWFFLFSVFLIISLGRLFCIHYISKQLEKS